MFIHSIFVGIFISLSALAGGPDVSTSPVFPPLVSIVFENGTSGDFGGVLTIVPPTGSVVTGANGSSETDWIPTVHLAGDQKEDWAAHLDSPVAFFIADLHAFVAGERPSSGLRQGLSAVRVAMSKTEGYGPVRAQALGEDEIAGELCQYAENYRRHRQKLYEAYVTQREGKKK